LIQSSLQQLGYDADDRVVYESMLIDAATVFYRRNAKAAVCAWRATDEYAEVKLQQLIDCSLVKVVDGGLWVHDVIKAIAVRKAHTENKQCMTRVWLPEQVTTDTLMCLVVYYCTYSVRH
jgi:hypothetical protein